MIVGLSVNKCAAVVIVTLTAWYSSCCSRRENTGLDSQRLISGRVCSGVGSPVSGAQVEIVSTSLTEDGSWSALTGRDGTFSVRVTTTSALRALAWKSKNESLVPDFLGSTPVLGGVVDVAIIPAGVIVLTSGEAAEPRRIRVDGFSRLGFESPAEEAQLWDLAERKEVGADLHLRGLASGRYRLLVSDSTERWSSWVDVAVSSGKVSIVTPLLERASWLKVLVPVDCSDWIAVRPINGESTLIYRRSFSLFKDGQVEGFVIPPGKYTLEAAVNGNALKAQVDAAAGKEVLVDWR